MLAGHFGGRLRYCKISPVYTLSTVVGTRPDSAQFPNQCGRAQGRHSPPPGLCWVCSSSEDALQRQGGRMECSGMAHPHFGLSLSLSFHSQRVLKTSRQPHILTEKEDSMGVRPDRAPGRSHRLPCCYINSNFFFNLKT